jgi:hypothetical protein
MRLTIIKDDNMVSVNGEHRTVDCSDLPADFHALQWYGELKTGEVEYRVVKCEHCGSRHKKSNLDISDVAPYQIYVDRWNVARPQS